MPLDNHSQQIVQKLWNYCNVLREDGLSNQATTYSGRSTHSDRIRAERAAAQTTKTKVRRLPRRPRAYPLFESLERAVEA